MERSAKVREDEDTNSGSSEDSGSESEKEIDYEETEASCIVKCHDVAVVCTGDFHIICNISILLGEIR